MNCEIDISPEEQHLSRYRVEAEPVKTKGGDWLDVTIYFDADKIGSYQRHYSTLFNTFVPFIQRHGDEIKEYALFSDDYTRTAVMELPSCRVVAQEPGGALGFCPVDFYVPYESPYGWGEEDIKGGAEFEGIPGHFGFVAGCHWGDDTSWKVEYLDLSRISEGILTRSQPFGYHELPRDVALKDAVDTTLYYVGRYRERIFNDRRVYIASRKLYDLNKPEDDSNGS